MRDLGAPRHSDPFDPAAVLRKAGIDLQKVTFLERLSPESQEAPHFHQLKASQFFQLEMFEGGVSRGAIWVRQTDAETHLTPPQVLGVFVAEGYRQTGLGIMLHLLAALRVEKIWGKQKPLHQNFLRHAMYQPLWDNLERDGYVKMETSATGQKRVSFLSDKLASHAGDVAVFYYLRLQRQESAYPYPTGQLTTPKVTPPANVPSEKIEKPGANLGSVHAGVPYH